MYLGRVVGQPPLLHRRQRWLRDVPRCASFSALLAAFICIWPFGLSIIFQNAAIHLACVHYQKVVGVWSYGWYRTRNHSNRLKPNTDSAVTTASKIQTFFCLLNPNARFVALWIM